MTFTDSGNTLNIVSGTSYIDTDGNDVTMDQLVTGANGSLIKIGGGNLTLNNFAPRSPSVNWAFWAVA